MATLQSPWREGDAFGFRYVFEAAGDGLPEHAHIEEELEHDVTCVCGRVAILLDCGFLRILKAGERCEFNSWKVHRIIALEPAEIINKIDRGLPAQYAHLTDEELSGRIEVPIDLYLE